MMREEGKGKRQEKQESLYTQNPTSNIRITNASITFHQVQGYLAKGRQWVPLAKQVRSEVRGRCGGRFITMRRKVYVNCICNEY